jgi:hypothetical protein
MSHRVWRWRIAREKLPTVCWFSGFLSKLESRLILRKAETSKPYTDIRGRAQSAWAHNRRGQKTCPGRCFR